MSLIHFQLGRRCGEAAVLPRGPSFALLGLALFVGAPDPALASRCLEMFEVVLQPAKSEMKPVGGAQRTLLCSPSHSCALRCTSTARPALRRGFCLVLMVKTGGRRGQTALEGQSQADPFWWWEVQKLAHPKGQESPTTGSWELAWAVIPPSCLNLFHQEISTQLCSGFSFCL